jgi:hypothetical protein
VIIREKPDKARVEEIRREIECLREEYAGSTSGGKIADEANEARRQRLLELKLELAQTMRKVA